MCVSHRPSRLLRATTQAIVGEICNSGLETIVDGRDSIAPTTHQSPRLSIAATSAHIPQAPRAKPDKSSPTGLANKTFSNNSIHSIDRFMQAVGLGFCQGRSMSVVHKICQSDLCCFGEVGVRWSSMTKGGMAWDGRSHTTSPADGPFPGLNTASSRLSALHATHNSSAQQCKLPAADVSATPEKATRHDSCSRWPAESAPLMNFPAPGRT